MRGAVMLVFRALFAVVARGTKLFEPLFKAADRLTAWMSK